MIAEIRYNLNNSMNTWTRGGQSITLLRNITQPPAKKEDRGAISINRVLAKKANSAGQGATTSITRVGPTASAPSDNVSDYNKIRDAGADRRRYAYIRRLIKTKQAEEKNKPTK